MLEDMENIKAFGSKSEIGENPKYSDLLTMAPTITVAQIVFRCNYHPKVFARLSPELITLINKYQYNQVSYESKHQDDDVGNAS